MAIENKQNTIIDILEKRIKEGFYEEKLPRALDLAEEFEVNFKTLNKAILQLVKKGLVYRKPGKGTFIKSGDDKLENSLIELLFVGSSDMSIHPFYSDMWRGILDSIQGTGYKIVLTMLDENKEYGGLKEVCRDLTPSAGKVLIGTNNAEQIKLLKRSKVPFILAGEACKDSNIITVYYDCSEAIDDAVVYLRKQGVKDIAFIGQTRDDGEHLVNLNNFHAYLSAIQQKGELDSELIENTPPFAHLGYTAMKNILSRKIPQALILSYDHLAKGVYEAIRDFGLEIPSDIKVMSIGGTSPDLQPELTSIELESRYQAGLKAGETLLAMIRTSGQKQTSHIFTGKFNPRNGKSI